MLRATAALRFRMHMGEMLLDYKLTSRDMRRSARVEGAVVDTTRRFCTAPMHWLEELRSPSLRLPTGYYRERPVYVAPPGAAVAAGAGPSGASTPRSAASPAAAAAKAYVAQSSAAASGKKSASSPAVAPGQEPNAIRAGPLIMYIDGEASPVVVNVDFVNPADWGMAGNDDCDMRIGLEAIEQCTLFHELRPGGLLSRQGVDVLRQHKTLGMQTKLAESPLATRPWTRMKTFFIDELQRGPPLREYIGYNARVGHQWRFSQHCKYFRMGIWREMTRRNELIEGLQSHSSFQRSPQQSVPEVRFLAPGP